jgi:hypothetical protein
MSKLEEISVGYRKCEIAKNSYNNNDQYNAGNANALSTGDELGKGLQNGQIGGATDIKMRECLTAKNEFNKNKEYNNETA